MVSEKYLTQNLKLIRDNFNQLFKKNNLNLIYDDCDENKLIYILKFKNLVLGVIGIKVIKISILEIEINISSMEINDVNFTILTEKLKIYASKKKIFLQESDGIATKEFPYDSHHTINLKKITMNEHDFIIFIQEVLDLTSKVIKN